MAAAHGKLGPCRDPPPEADLEGAPYLPQPCWPLGQTGTGLPPGDLECVLREPLCDRSTVAASLCRVSLVAVSKGRIRGQVLKEGRQFLKASG